MRLMRAGTMTSKQPLREDECEQGERRARARIRTRTHPQTHKQKYLHLLACPPRWLAGWLVGSLVGWLAGWLPLAFAVGTGSRQLGPDLYLNWTGPGPGRDRTMLGPMRTNKDRGPHLDQCEPIRTANHIWTDADQTKNHGSHLDQTKNRGPHLDPCGPIRSVDRIWTNADQTKDHRNHRDPCGSSS